MKQDVPPPYTAVARHAVFPEPTHDEAARYNFLTALNKYLSGSIGPGNKIKPVRAANFPAKHRKASSPRH